VSALTTALELALAAFDFALSKLSAKDRAEVERRAEFRLRKRRELREEAQAALNARRRKKR
jgi:hypothetical protein